MKDGKITLKGCDLDERFLSVKLLLKREGLSANQELGGESDIKILLDLSQDDKMKEEGTGREIINKIQRLRKKAGMKIEDDITVFVFWKENSTIIKHAFVNQHTEIESVVKKPTLAGALKPNYFYILASEEYEYEKEFFEVVICASNLVLNKKAVDAKYAGLYDVIGKTLACYPHADLSNKLKTNGHITFKLDSKDIILEAGKEIDFTFKKE